jgi:hypothetical protein
MFGAKKYRGIPCLRCGYDITGLPREGVCPECALPLRNTLEASDLLRSWPIDDVRRLSRGLSLLAWSPAALLLGLLPGIWLFALLSLFSPDSGVGAAVIAIGAGCVAAAVCFALGCLVLTRSVPARSVAPSWTIPVLRVTGPTAAALALLSPIRFIPLRHDPVTAYLIGFLCQGVTLAALAAMIRFCHSIEARTVIAGRPVIRHWISWATLAIVVTIWVCGYWVAPMTHSRWPELEAGDWREGWALGFFLLHGFSFWKLSDAVRAEEVVALYEQESS